MPQKRLKDDAELQNAIRTLRRVREEGPGGPVPDTPSPLGGVQRLKGLLTGEGPMSDVDLLNARSYEGEPLWKVKNRLLGTPKPAVGYGVDASVPVDDSSAPMKMLRGLRRSIGF